MWKVERVPTSNKLLIMFAGDMEAKEGQPSADLAKKLLGVFERIEFFADFSELVSYSPLVRKAWQDTFLPLRSRLKGVHLITRSAIVTMGVRAFALFCRVELVIYKTRDDFYKAYNNNAKAA